MKSYRTGPETTRLILRAMTVDDAADFFALNGNPIVMRYTHEPLLRSLKDARELLRCYPDFDTHGFGRWGCVLKETRQLIGFCGLKYLADYDEVDIGYRLLPGFWGRGLATEASRACIQFGFETLRLKRILGLVLPENTASIRVLEKSGLTFRDEIEDDGLRVLRYAIDREEMQ